MLCCVRCSIVIIVSHTHLCGDAAVFIFAGWASRGWAAAAALFVWSEVVDFSSVGGGMHGD